MYYRIIKKILSIVSLASIPLLCGNATNETYFRSVHNKIVENKVSIKDNFFVDISAGTEHSLALDSYGNLWAWGRNTRGQIGNGHKISVSRPIQIMRGTKFKKISAGNDGSLAIDEDNKVWQWGRDKNLIPTLVDSENSYININSNEPYDSMLRIENTTYSKYFGYLTQTYSDEKEVISDLKEKMPTYLENSMVGLSKDESNFYALNEGPIKSIYVSQIYGGSSFSATTLSTKEIKLERPSIACDSLTNIEYKRTHVGESGGGSTYRYDPSIKSVYAFVLDDGQPFIYGNSLFNYDDNPFKNRYVDCSISNVDDANKCTAFFVNQNGKIESYGYNSKPYNMLGNSSEVNNLETSKVVTVESEASFIKVSAGKNHVLALDNNGRIYSWGSNAYGQLGTDDSISHKVPTIVNTLANTKSFSFDVLNDETFNDSFKQNGGSNYTLVEAPSKGALDIDKSTGEFSYKANPGAFGDDTAVISIDYGPNTIEYQVDIYIDRKPYLAGGETEFNVNYLSSHTGKIPVMDPDNDKLNFSISKYPSKGNIIIDSQLGTYTYTSMKDCAGTDEFTVAVNDGYYTLYTTIKVHVETTITLNDTTSIFLDNTNPTSYSGNLNANDLDGDEITYSITGNPSKGTLTIDETGGYKYTPRNGEYGQDTFTLQATDGKTPVLATYNVELFQIKDNDTELNNKIGTGSTLKSQVKVDAKNCTPNFSVKTDGEKGNVTINKETGEYTYVPKLNTRGNDSFVINVNYGYGNYDVTINVYQNTAADDSLIKKEIVIKQNTNYIGNVTCSDIDNDSLRYKVSVNPHLGNIDLNSLTGEYTYYPSRNAAGWDNVIIDVEDGVNVTSISLKIKIESEIQVESTIQKIINQNSSLAGNVNASDKDGDTLSYKLKKSPTNGSASVDTATGDYTYVPNTGYYGNDYFIVEADDGTNPKEVTVSVKVNRKPITDNIEYNLLANGNSVSGSAKCTDPDGDKLTYYIGKKPTMGQVILDKNTGNFAYVPNSDAAGDDIFIVTATDGNDEIMVTVHIHNETELTIDSQETDIVVNQGKSTTGQVHATDLDGDTLTYKLKDIPTQGMVNINEHTGAWTYTATSKAVGTDRFSVEVTDGNTIKSITYNLIINTPSVFEEGTIDSFSTNINTAYNGSVKASDANGDLLTYSVVSQGQKGSVIIDPTTGRYVYTPINDASGDDTFVIGVSDGFFTTELMIKAHIETEIQVEAGTQTVNVNKNSVVTGKTNASDADGDTLTYSIYKQGQKGNANVTNDGSWSYFANNGAGSDIFIIEVSDGTHKAYVTVFVHIDSEPSFESGNISITVGQGQSISSQAVATDEDGDTLEFTLKSQPSNGTINLNSKTGEYEYTAFSNSTASSDSFVISVTDGKTTKEVRVNVLINNAPIVIDGSLKVNQNGSGKGMVEASDPENDKLSYAVGTQGTHGNITINSETGEYVYTTTERNYYGSDSFSINVSDGFTTKTIVVNVDIVKNSAPMSAGTIVRLDSGTSTSGTIYATDKENDNLIYSITQQGDKGNAVINEETGEFTYAARPDTKGYDCFIVTVNDGYQTKSFLVEVDINFVDSYNSRAIPTVATVSSIAALSLGFGLFPFLFKRKRK